MIDHDGIDPVDEIELVDTELGMKVPALPEADIAVDLHELEQLAPYNRYLLPSLQQDLEAVVSSAGPNLPLLPAKSEIDADYAVPAHRLLAADPEAFNHLLESISEADDEQGCFEVVAEGPFINIKIKRDVIAPWVIEEVLAEGDNYGKNGADLGRTVVLDVSSPNIAKQMHLGHLRSTVIGEAMTRILRANGVNAIRDNHLGDWGTQFGMLGHAFELWGDEIPELKNPSTQVTGLLKLYVKINQEVLAEKESSADGESPLEDAGRAWFTRLEEGDPAAKRLWQWTYNLSRAEFEEVYQRLGVEFEYTLGESLYSHINSEVFRAFVDRGLAAEDDKGRLKLVPSDEKMHALTIRKSDGSSLYGTRDLACLASRLHWFDPNEVIYAVGAEQTDYFKQVFDGFSQFAGDETPELTHLAFGPIELPDGKMSTRKGRVVFLSEVLDEAHSQALDRVTSNMERRGIEIDDEHIDQVAWDIAVGAIIYYDLKQPAGRKIVFDWDEALNFQGNSGPFLQYTNARINALLEKAGDAEVEAVTSSTDASYFKEDTSGVVGDLTMLMAEFPVVVRRAGTTHNPTLVAEHLYKLAHNFNSFYRDYPILSPDTSEDDRRSRLLLTAAASQVLKNGLKLLNIPAPDRI